MIPKTFRTILLANWGMGLEIIKVLDARADISLLAVGSHYDEMSSDPWENAVHDYAVSHNLPWISQKDISFVKLKEIILEKRVDLLMCHSFMRILPEDVLFAPALGSVNVHASLLPKYRGPAPTYWVLKNSDKKTGLTFHYMDAGIDTGDIIHQVEVDVYPDDSVKDIIERQKQVVGRLIDESFSRLHDEQFVALRQDHAAATFAPKPN